MTWPAKYEKRNPIPTSGTRICTKCHQEKPITEFRVRPDKRINHGIGGYYRDRQCRQCHNAIVRVVVKKWLDKDPANREKSRQAARERAKLHPQKMGNTELLKVRRLLGNKCHICGKTQDPQIHHLRPKNKHQLTTKRSEKYKETLRNPLGVILLCKQHHQIAHMGNEQSYQLLKQLLK